MAGLEDSLDLTLRQVLPVIQKRIMNESRYFEIPTWKSPTDFWIYQELLCELRPDVIVEDGILNHGLDWDQHAGPYEAVESFVSNNSSFVIDRGREAFLITWNPKGYLRRVEVLSQAEVS